MIILIGGEKGGTGKTTLASALAVMRAKDGHDVLMVDTDKQGSASAWAATRDEAEVTPRIPCVSKFGKSLPADLRELAKRFEDLIVDAGGRDSIELRSAMVAADRLYIPITPGQFDVWTLGTMRDLIEQARGFNEHLEGAVIINRASANPVVGETAEAAGIAAECGLDLAQTIIRDRIAHRHAVRAGLAAVELQPQDHKASAELHSLAAEVFGPRQAGRQSA